MINSIKDNLPSIPEKNIKDFIDQIINSAVEGKGPLAGAEELAQGYLADSSYSSLHEMSVSLIRREASKNFGSGFITGLGGAVTLPVTIPASLYSSWVLQARMAAAIARIYNHDLSENRVRTMILLSILGDSGKELLKKAGIAVTEGLLREVIKGIPAKALKEINKAVGFRLLTRSGEKGVVNLTKIVPVAGGLVSGVLDAVSCIVTGRTAERLFRIEDDKEDSGGKKEAFPILVSSEQLTRVLSENSNEISSVTIPGAGIIAIKPSLVPFSVRFSLVTFSEGVAKLRAEGNPLVRAITRHRLGEVVDFLPPEFRKCIYMQGNLIIINLPVLIRDTLNIKGIEISEMAILPEGIGITLQ